MCIMELDGAGLLLAYCVTRTLVDACVLVGEDCADYPDAVSPADRSCGGIGECADGAAAMPDAPISGPVDGAAVGEGGDVPEVFDGGVCLNGSRVEDGCDGLRGAGELPRPFSPCDHATGLIINGADIGSGYDGETGGYGARIFEESERSVLCAAAVCCIDATLSCIQIPHRPRSYAIVSLLRPVAAN